MQRAEIGVLEERYQVRLRGFLLRQKKTGRNGNCYQTTLTIYALKQESVAQVRGVLEDRCQVRTSAAILFRRQKSTNRNGNFCETALYLRSETRIGGAAMCVVENRKMRMHTHMQRKVVPQLP